MNYMDFRYWTNLPIEEKSGKYMTFIDLNSRQSDYLVSNVPVIGDLTTMIVPLDAMDLTEFPGLDDLSHLAVEVVDVKWLFKYPVLRACNLRSL